MNNYLVPSSRAEHHGPVTGAARKAPPDARVPFMRSVGKDGVGKKTILAFSELIRVLCQTALVMELDPHNLVRVPLYTRTLGIAERGDA